ncbi:hypothetical protein CICLE_v100136031mg, partial [Citrus x clementina]
NAFTGRIPTCFGGLSGLKTLDLSYNKFVGVVPDAIMKLRNLRELILKGNPELGGVFPGWVGNFSMNLEKLDFSFNSFCGEIPESLYYLKSLKHLDLEKNNLTGNVHDFY